MHVSVAIEHRRDSVVITADNPKNKAILVCLRLGTGLTVSITGLAHGLRACMSITRDVRNPPPDAWKSAVRPTWSGTEHQPLVGVERVSCLSPPQAPRDLCSLRHYYETIINDNTVSITSLVLALDYTCPVSVVLVFRY